MEEKVTQEAEVVGNGLEQKAEDGGGHEEAETPAPLSKNARKKMEKRARMLEYVKAKKVEKKAAKRSEREDKRQQSAAYLDALTEEERQAEIAKRKESKQGRIAKQRERRENKQRALQEGQSIEVRSLTQQLIYCYAANSRASTPCKLCFTSVKGVMAERFDRIPGVKHWPVVREEQSYMDVYSERKEDLVYLTADSPNTMNELDPKKAYIIGGIHVTLEKAQSQNIATAKLPIDPTLLKTSSVLTVNHVLEILLNWLDCRSWPEAVARSVPSRKRAAESTDGDDDERDADKNGNCTDVEAGDAIEHAAEAVNGTKSVPVSDAEAKPVAATLAVVPSDSSNPAASTEPTPT
eukprot:jgi/Chlat1/702/Chrsp104S01285